MKTYSELLAELEKLKQDIDAVREYEASLIAERVLALLAESGVDIRSIAACVQSKPRERKRIKPKYWDPKTGVTWSGRGRTPRWLVGKDPEMFRVPLDTSDE
ncbi:H-NS family nucleoid-associated regulatory protein [Burkholderia stagnalis]|uniref:H-NS histone family protein n=1 Tax=Burkholderia stagnalis TaxID=1503054 RepID=UPI000756B32B|nr:H-NS histone family protein [Burkholderia stagnalis]KVM89592.1 H-NS histone [Burkholderia stagnalis]